ncbi:S-methyl-5'-thioadenosine phosphorylase isoform X2 [Falco peregrinus]|uniref:S-methyl-5'-thioadenosine phosphorylase isoform X2 n=2 Tax=Falco TaxID=8952 RepID=UPI002478BF8A|nr:S-methyl-5'-thioadenosine phosphorylase isoform X2 [Falco peregrinus]
MSYAVTQNPDFTPRNRSAPHAPNRFAKNSGCATSVRRHRQRRAHTRKTRPQPRGAEPGGALSHPRRGDRPAGPPRAPFGPRAPGSRPRRRGRGPGRRFPSARAAPPPSEAPAPPPARGPAAPGGGAGPRGAGRGRAGPHAARGPGGHPSALAANMAAAAAAVKIGIIGGTGLDDPDILEGRTEKYVDTPYGKPSDALILGKIKNVDCVLLARHGRHHTIMPSNINYRANIWALKEENCSHVLVTTACGSLREEIQPGDLVIIDQFIDKTTKRHCTLYDGQHSTLSGVCHIPMAEPFCTKTREVLIETAKKLGLQCHSKGTMITIEGPRFSSRAESLMFRSWGADVINMTTVPEVILAKEAGMSYASIAMATDYDCWKEHEEAVSVDKVLKTLKGNANKATSILLTAIPQIGSMEWTDTLHTLKTTVQCSVILPKQ